jgi:hypothetical protein
MPYVGSYCSPYPFFLRTTYKNEHKTPQPDDKAMLYFYFISAAIWVMLFYLNVYVFMPLILRAKKLPQFIILHLLAAGGAYILYIGYTLRCS